MIYFKKMFTLRSYNDFLKYLSLSILEALERLEARFYTIHWRPKQSKDVSVLPVSRTNEDSIAIVMQGPLCLTDDFTYNTCLQYKRFFPNSQLILSTWINEDAVTLDKIRDCGWTVLLSEQPTNRGYANINLLIKSTFTGVNEIRSGGGNVAYILKTRTDQRIYNQNALQFFLGLWTAFPSKDIQKQKGRLIVSMGTPNLRLYGVGDMVMFGHTDDMDAYWSVSQDERKAGDMASLVARQNSVESFAKLELSEVYLTTNYLRKLGYKLTWDLADSWNAIRDYFVVTEPSQIDLFWQKNSLHHEFRHYYYTMNHTWDMMTFADWLMLYQGNYNPSSVPVIDKVCEGASLEHPDTVHLQGKLT